MSSTHGSPGIAPGADPAAAHAAAPSNAPPDAPPASAPASARDGKYIVIAPYVPAHSDEIKLAVGDQIVILHMYDDGWVLGRNDTTSAIGLLPHNFLTPRHDRWR
ncbi:hypothetical protein CAUPRSCDRAFT_13000 [Caulochytrium protostelioides]|uniref:SH3 domain-containing protein n=1 Tax=Caulochytrium protostelioides TaxID=1555241 RepID=A0A4P9WV68_9FUNG|nr:hypothetical protein CAUPRSCDRAFT_13000 [Caulochytrium protostelioides]